MGALGGPPEEIGKKVAAALVGTFLGILLCYGLIGPLRRQYGQAGRRKNVCVSFGVLRVLLISFFEGI